jgi:uncharacterized protein with FMN-binding domain
MRRVLAAIFGTAAGTTLLIALKAGPVTGKSPTPAAVAVTPSTPAPPGPLPDPSPSTASPGPTGSRGAAAGHGPTSPPRPTGSARPAAGANGTFTGSVAQTQYGPVQVRIVMSGGRMTDVAAVQLPGGSARSVQINGRAAPILRQEALSAQNATIDTVSGATYTSQGYRTSLQAALDAAKRG